LSLEALDWKASLEKTRNVVVEWANWWNVYSKIWSNQMCWSTCVILKIRASL